MMELAPVIKDSGLQTKAEVILGLPGDSYDSHLSTLKTLLNASMDEILVFTCMLLPGSELYQEDERKKWGLITKHRILPRDFTKLSSGRIVIETEEVVVGSNSMTFDEYVDLRVFNFILAVTNSDTAFSALKMFLTEHGIGIFDVTNRMFNNLNSAPDCITKLCNDYRRATIDELWDSSEEILAHYQQESEFEKLLNGEAGINVLYHHQAIVFSTYMSEWTDYIFAMVKELLVDKGRFDEVSSRQFEDVANYSRGLSFNPLGSDRMATNPKFEFMYDIGKWLNHATSTNSLLADFRLSSPLEIEFCFTKDQFDIIQDQLDRFDNNVIGTSKALFASTYIPSHYYWRTPLRVHKATTYGLEST